jgi:hypothetical protein
MPFLTPDTTDQHDALATFASHQLQQLAATLHGLSHEQLAARPTASAMSLGALARHCLGVARDIEADIAAAPAGSARQESDPDTDLATAQAEGTIAPEALRADDTADGLSAALNSMAGRLATTIRAADLEAEIPVPEAPWFTGSERWNVRWRALHAVGEFARHAGHADIIRESLDGKTAYELNALADGEQWPPESW